MTKSIDIEPSEKISGRNLSNISDLFLKSLNFTKVNFLDLLMIQLIAVAPFVLFQARNFYLIKDFNSRLESLQNDNFFIFVKEFLANFFDPINTILIVLSLVFTLFGTVALYLAIIKADQKNPVNPLEAYKKGASFVITYFWATILSSVIVGAGLFAILIPGIIFLIWFLFYGFVIISEGKGIFTSLKRSRELVKGYWWKIFGRYLLAIFAISIISFIFGPFPEIPILSPIIQGVVTAVNAIFVAVYLFYIYKDLVSIKK